MGAKDRVPSTRRVRPTVFLSYSRKDAAWKDRVAEHLGVLRWLGQVDLWDDRRIDGGDDWRQKLERAIDRTSVAVLLISSRFLSSRFIMTAELPRLLEKSARDGTRLIPLLVEPSAWQAVPALGKRQLRPAHGRALSEVGDNQVARDLAALALEIQELLKTAGGFSDLDGFVPLPPERVELSRLPMAGEHLFGRSGELRFLDEAWYNPGQHVLSVVAWGGVGKTALVKHWLGRMAKDAFRGAELVFGWSFYSQGTRDSPTSADQFIDEALRFFGDPDPTSGHPREKGRRLARLVSERKTLLVLDGLEPLQYGPGPLEGSISDPALAACIVELAALHPGLCLITTRERVSEVAHLASSTAPRLELGHLEAEAGARLLSRLKVQGSGEEMLAASEAFGGHALALTLLGNYLAEVRDGDVRRWREVPLPDNDRRPGHHARRIIRSYELWLCGLDAGIATWSILRLMGFFDRPATAPEIEALLRAPPIRGLTEALAELDAATYRRLQSDLRRRNLLHPKTEAGGMDAHPLIREYLAESLRERFPRALEEGHRRLYEHFKGGIAGLPQDAAEMAPCYRAIAHGCLAGRHREAFESVYMPLVRQGGAFNTDRLRGFGDDFVALSGFLRKNRYEVVPALEEHSSFILGELGFDLRALGRLDEAVEAMSAALAWDRAQNHPDHRVNAARQADLLSTTHLIRGFVRDAVALGEDAVALAQGDDYHKMICLTTRADARLHAGDRDAAAADFAEAEAISGKIFAGRWPYLRSFQGCRYCELLLADGRIEEARQRLERALAWDRQGGYPKSRRSISLHVLQTEGEMLPLAFDHLTYARVLLAEGGAGASRFEKIEYHVEEARRGIDASATQHMSPRVFLVEAQLARARGELRRAEDKLRECLSICRRDRLRLYEATCHFELARVARDRGAAGECEQLLEEAGRKSRELGYGLLDEEIERFRPRETGSER